MILFSKQITKALISQCGCAGWSAPLLFANPQRQVFSRRGPNMNMYTTIIHVMVHGCNIVMISLYVLHFRRARNILEKHKKFLVNMDYLKQSLLHFLGCKTCKEILVNYGIRMTNNYSRTCLKQPLKNRQNKYINSKW